jgi:hypothetical protein
MSILPTNSESHGECTWRFIRHLALSVCGLGAVVSRYVVCILFCTSCEGASPDRGLDLQLRVRTAQIVRAPFPKDRGGPALTFVDLRDPRVGAGETDNPVVGRAAAGTYGINVGVEGDAGYWVLPAGLPDDVNVGELQFRVPIDYARNLRPGNMRILLQAVDAAGVSGPSRVVLIEVVAPTPAGALVATLEWDAEVDADLVVVLPNGVSVSAKNINSSEPSPIGAQPSAADARLLGGVLDQDSNANCTIDGLRRESIYWKAAPPVGRYQVYASLASTCGLPRTSIRVSIRHGGVVRNFYGALYASDSRSQPLDPPESPGLLIAEFDVPK